MSEIIDITPDGRRAAPPPPRCPHCGSEQLSMTRGAYNSGCGCLGLLLFGWLGLLLGLLGMDRLEMVCMQCGTRWPVGRPDRARKTGGCLATILIVIIVLAILGAVADALL